MNIDLKSALTFYEHLKKLSIPNGLWFCTPVEAPRRFLGWVIPPYTIEQVFSISANNTLCTIERVGKVPQHIQDVFDRFGISSLSKRYLFEFNLPQSVISNEIVLTCQFSDEVRSVFYSYFWTESPQVETPAFNMMRVAQSDDPSYFRFSGYSQYQHIKALIQKYASNTSVILDWGCGSARVLRYFATDPLFRTIGVDIDSYNIEWCQQALGDKAEFYVIEQNKPCVFPDSSIDIIYGLSVFTHLNLASQNFWLAELHRLLKPGGLAVMSVHGELTFFKAINDFWEYERFVKNGFLDIGPNNDLRVDGKETINENLYRNVFHTRPYIETVWGQYFRIIDYIPGAVVAHQDYVIMIRK